MHCESSLFVSDFESSTKNCKVHVFPNTLLPKPQYLKDGMWAIATNETLRMSVSCKVPSERVIVVKPPLTLFQLNESCFATPNYFTIPARNTFESKIKMESDLPRIADLNIKNISLWQPIRRVMKTLPTLKLPKKLENVKSYPMNKLIEELDQVKSNPIDGNQTEKYLYIIMNCIGILSIVVASIIFFKWKGIPNKKKKVNNVQAVTSTLNGNDPEETELNLGN